MGNGKGLLFLHDYTRRHVPRMARDTVPRIGLNTLYHPPYSADFAPTDYHLSHIRENYLLGKFFRNEVDLQQAHTDRFSSKTPDSFFYCQGISQLERRWQNILHATTNSMSNLVYDFPLINKKIGRTFLVTIFLMDIHYGAKVWGPQWISKNRQMIAGSVPYSK